METSIEPPLNNYLKIYSNIPQFNSLKFICTLLFDLDKSEGLHISAKFILKIERLIV
jgi:hypothetical protein